MFLHMLAWGIGFAFALLGTLAALHDLFRNR